MTNSRRTAKTKPDTGADDFLNAAAYYRRSKPDAGARAAGQASRSVTEQRSDSHGWAGREHWNIVAEYEDDGISASSRSTVKRPGWAALKARLARGGIDVLITWESSRTTRDMAAYVELRELCATHGVLLAYNGKTYDMTQRDDRFKTGIDALVAENESEQTRERILRTIGTQIDSGKPHGKQAYGYVRTYDSTSGRLVGQEPHPTEAPIVRRIVKHVARGGSMNGLAHTLNLEGVPAPKAKLWTQPAVRRIARSLTYAGVREHLSKEEKLAAKVAGREPVAIRYDATWTPLVSEALVMAARARTDGNVAHKAMPSCVALYLLSGIARCGLCGEKMVRGKHHLGHDLYHCKNRLYVDAAGKAYGGGHSSVSLEGLDLHVTNLVLGFLENPETARLLAEEAPEPNNPNTTELAALTARLDDARRSWKRGKLTADDFADFKADIEPEIARLEASARRTALSPVVADALDNGFESLTLADKREAIKAIVNVAVLPCRLDGVNRKMADRVTHEWRVAS